MTVDFDVGSRSLAESNWFLRALWAELRERFGRCAWHYQPVRVRQENSIIVGFADIGISDSVVVELVYKTKSTIRRIRCTPGPNTLASDREQVEQQLAAAVRAALNRVGNRESRGLRISVQTVPPWFHASHSGLKFALHGYRNAPGAELTLQVEGYDNADRQYVAGQCLRQCLAVLAVYTNSAYVVTQPPKRSDTSQSQDQCSPGDAATPANDRLAISGQCSRWLDAVIGANLTQRQSIFIDACAHFHSACLLATDFGYAPTRLVSVSDFEDAAETERNEAEVGNGRPPRQDSLYHELGEHIIVWCMSALEVASTLHGAAGKRCAACGQLRYSIRQRVLDTVKEVGDPDMVRFIDQAYAARSSYLHSAGLGRWKYARTNEGGIPLLDPRSKSGCTMISHDQYAAREIVGHIIRALGDRGVDAD